MDLILSYLGELLHSEVAKMTVAFTIAARAHQYWVKKNIAEHVAFVTEQMTLLRNSIDHVAVAMGSRLDEHDERIGRLEDK